MSKWKEMWRLVGIALAVALCAGFLAACGDDDDGGGGTPEGEIAGLPPDIQTNPPEPAEPSEFYNRDEHLAQVNNRFEDPEDFGAGDDPWVQAINPELVDTSEFKTDPPWNVCFSNAAVDNPWRQVGFDTMNIEVTLHDDIANYEIADAEASDETQISDIEAFVSGGDCDALIVSPNTTKTLTPAVEDACKSGIPVIVFDRGVDTDCPTTFIHPIGGYAFGADGAEFLAENVAEGGKILALRILPGVDVLETRWEAAQAVFQSSDLEVVGEEFTEGDAANTKSIVSDYIEREGGLDGIWMDAGATSVAATEAFEDAGLDVPPITGEDQLDFLQKWRDDDLTAIAPVYSNFQWRTPVIAAEMILSGEEVPKEWILPQPAVTEDNLEDTLAEEEGLPPLHYALCGCEELPGYPEEYQE